MAQSVQNLPASAGHAGDLGLIPGSGKSPGVGNGNTLQYSCLENSMDRGVCQARVQRVTHGVTELNVTEHSREHSFSGHDKILIVALPKPNIFYICSFFKASVISE